MFKLIPAPTFCAVVAIPVPGQAEPETVDVEFRALSRSATVEFFAAAEGKTDTQALSELVVGWHGVDAEYSAENLAILLDNYPLAARALFEAFNAALFEARRKN